MGFGILQAEEMMRRVGLGVKCRLVAGETGLQAFKFLLGQPIQITRVIEPLTGLDGLQFTDKLGPVICMG